MNLKMKQKKIKIEKPQITADFKANKSSSSEDSDLGMQ